MTRDLHDYAGELELETAERLDSWPGLETALEDSAWEAMVEEEFRIEALPAPVQNAFHMGALAWPLAIQRAIAAGIHDPGELADIVFFMHYPERKGRALRPAEPNYSKLAAQWKAFRTLVLPLLRRSKVPSPTAPTVAVPAVGTGRIQDRTSFTATGKRKRVRPLRNVYALVLHQTAFSRGNVPRKYDTVTAHFVILPDGQILQLHPISALLWTSNGFNARSVAVEFVGNFPSTRGRCWKPERFGCHRLSTAQIDSGRYLVRYLVARIGLTHVLAHRQSSASRENDPGPDIWCQVGQWAVDEVGLDDGGPGFRIGDGSPIPVDWRTWCRGVRGGRNGELWPFEAASQAQEFSHGDEAEEILSLASDSLDRLD